MSVTSMAIADIRIEERFRKDLGNVSSLADSIKEVGLLQPIVVDESGRLVAGYRRLEACRSLGWTTVPVHTVKLAQIVKGEFYENTARKNFTASEIVTVKRELEPSIREEAKKRQGRRTDLGKEHPAESAQSRDIISEYAGVSHDSLRKMERLVEAAEKDAARFGPILQKVDQEKMSLNKALSLVLRAQTQSPEPAQRMQKGRRPRRKGRPHPASTARVLDDSSTPTENPIGSPVETTEHLEEAVRPTLEKESGMPQFSAPLVKCPRCGADSTELVWKCCGTPFRPERLDDEADRPERELEAGQSPARPVKPVQPSFEPTRPPEALGTASKKTAGRTPTTKVADAS